MTITMKNGVTKVYNTLDLTGLNANHNINVEIRKLHKELDIIRAEVTKMADEESIDKVIKYYNDGLEYFTSFAEMYKKIVRFNDLLVKAEKIEKEIITLEQQLDEIK